MNETLLKEPYIHLSIWDLFTILCKRTLALSNVNCDISNTVISKYLLQQSK